MTREQLQAEFCKETGLGVINSDGEFDIDYVLWLEAKIANPKHKCAFYVNADWTGYTNCSCGKSIDG